MIIVRLPKGVLCIVPVVVLVEEVIRVGIELIPAAKNVVEIGVVG